MQRRRFPISFNSPVVLSYSLLCLIALVLSALTDHRTNQILFSVYRSSLTNPLTYVRFFGHICGHVSWEHFTGNIMLLLVTGPMLEEKYGSSNILTVILSTALVTGIVHFIFFPGVQLLGASGVVFAFILLSSFGSSEDGSIPITFLLVAGIYLGGQLYDGLFSHDSVSNLSHILGGAVGSGLGFAMNRYRSTRFHA